MADFHFIRPLWLLALLALVLLIWQLKKLRLSSSAWHKVIPKHLTTMLLSGDENKKPISLITPTFIGLLIIFALAGPTWQKLPQPVFTVERGSVIVMDMSFSMLATDIKPNRLTRSRFKAMDLVRQINEGEIGLIAYAGDAFIISPLTSDINNINLLLPSLAPEIMPELGSNPYPALMLADQMLQNSGHLKGDIYWFTDGIDMDELQDINDFVSDHNHRVNILGVGTEQGAPITLANGELMKDRGGNIVIPKTNQQLLAGISARSDGIFSAITADDNDIVTLGERPSAQAKNMAEQQDNLGDQWQEAGPYLLLLALPLLLSYFRRGILFSPLFLAMMLCPTMYAPKAQANLWDDLWQTQDQQALEKFNKQQYDDAAKQFKDRNWQASSSYRAGNYEQALKQFKQIDSVDSLYNQGNSLAKLGELQQALEHYQQVLAQQPEHQDALANKALVEQLLQQQEQNQEQDQKQDQQQDQKQDQQQDQKQDQKQDQQKDQKQDQQQDQKQDQQQSDNSQQSQGDNAEQQNENQDPQQNETDQESQPQENNNAEQNPNEEQSEQQSKENEQQNAEQNDSEQQQQAAAQNDNGETDEQNKTEQEQMAGMTDSEKAELNEQNQKYEQLLNKVTDDPHLLLRNKMKLEYQKRRQNRSSIGVKEKW